MITGRESAIISPNQQQVQGPGADSPRKFNARDYLRRLCPDAREIAEELDRKEQSVYDQ